MSATRTAIVGAGIAGIAVARELWLAGDDVTLFDKGRNTGGRVSTRRAAPWQFDHGAQYFTARDQRFGRVVDELIANGAAATWPGPFRTIHRGQRGDDPRPGAMRLVGVPGMSALARTLANDLDVRSSHRVIGLLRRDDAWWLATEAHSDSSEFGPFDRVALAVPPQQALALLPAAATTSPVAVAASRLREALQPCLCAMVAFQTIVPGAEGGHFVVNDDALTWVAHDGGKPGRGNAPTYVLHATAEWSQAHFDRDPSEWADELVAATERVFAIDLPPTEHVIGHRWGYALVAGDAPPATHTIDTELGLALIGDAHAGGRVEGAFCSGLALADAWRRSI